MNWRYVVIRGLINRCCRLLVTMLKLARENKNGETIALLSRCISESCIKARWLINKNDSNMFLRFVADGFKAEFELKSEIISKIEERNKDILPIELRMLHSIQETLSSCPYSEEEMRNAKKLPNLVSMCDHLGLESLVYVVIQRIGSHAVHGTWTDLLTNYLENDDKGFRLRDNNVLPSDDQLLIIVVFLLETIKDYVDFLLSDLLLKEEIVNHISKVKKQILDDYYQVIDDFKI